MFGPAMAYRDKHRLQPCEPKPRPAEARRIYKSPFLTGLAPRASARKQHSADRSRACELKQRALFLNRANAACVWGGAVIAEVTIHRAERLRLAQRCELQKTISPKNDCKQRKPTNCKNRRTTKNGDRTTVRKQLFLINPPAPLRRQRTAESTNHTDKSRNPCHSGCEVAVERRYR